MKKLFSLLVGIVLLIIPSMEAHAAGSVTKAYVTVTAPKVGAKPIMKGTVPSSASTMVTKVVWSGNLDENGCFKAGEAYTVKVYLQMKSGMDKVFRNISTAEWKINGKGATFKEVASSSGKKCTLEYSFERIGMGSNVIRTADFTIKEPVPGQKPSKDVIILNNSEIEVVDLKWGGKFDEEGNFMTHRDYSATLRIRVKPGCIGSFNWMDRDNNHFTINGKRVHIGKGGTKTEVSLHWKGYTDSSIDYLDMSKLYTQEQADRLYKTYNPITLNFARIFMEEQEKKGEASTADGIIDSYVLKMSSEDRLRVEKAIVNISDRSSFHFMMEELPNVKEIWFDTNAEPAFILAALMGYEHNTTYHHGSKGGMTRNMTIYLPASKYPKGLISIQEQNRGNLFWSGNLKAQILRFRTCTYTGKLYQAMSNKEATCTTYCPGHDFSAKVPAAHTLMRQSTCKQNQLFYYCCKYCGECEYNPKHTYQMCGSDENKSYACSHTYVMYDLSDKNYLGRNSKGEKVYCTTCCFCGINEREEIAKMTQAEYLRERGPNPEVSLEVFKQVRLESMDKGVKKYVLNETFSDDPKPMYFAVVDDDHGAKTSSWAVNETKWAMANKLIDKAVLGTDYLKSINRLQLASLAVRLIEQMLEREISPAPAGTYSDSDNIYVLKAHAAGVMSGKNGGSFAPTSTATRQDMATAIFNALQYVKRNSAFRYTVYTPDLDKFSDKSQIAEWALEAMGFTHRLGIIKETTKTTIEPLKACSIEDAVVAAHRGYYADEIGWYQCVPFKEEVKGVGISSVRYIYNQPISNSGLAIQNYYNGDRIWVDQPWIGRCQKRGVRTGIFLSFIDEHSGTRVYVKSGNWRPIKDI